MARTMPSADQVAAKWAQNLSASVPAIKAGVQAVTTAPGQAAALQKSAYLSGVQSAGDRWAANVSAVSLQSWQNSTITKGVDRVASGAQAAQPKFQTAMQTLLPKIAAAVNGLPARGGLEANILRSASFARAMAATKTR